MKDQLKGSSPPGKFSMVFLLYNQAKGQLISKCLIGSIVSTIKPTKFFKNFGPRGQIKKIKALYYTN